MSGFVAVVTILCLQSGSSGKHRQTYRSVRAIGAAAIAVRVRGGFGGPLREERLVLFADDLDEPGQGIGPSVQDRARPLALGIELVGVNQRTERVDVFRQLDWFEEQVCFSVDA